MIIINPGTEADPNATEANAVKVADYLVEDFATNGHTITYQRQSSADNDGWFRFIFSAGEKSTEVDIPGDDPDTVAKGMPFESRRLYVDGSSWLYGFAFSRMSDYLGFDS